jgi:hypothetical protein
MAGSWLLMTLATPDHSPVTKMHGGGWTDTVSGGGMGRDDQNVDV